MEKCKHGFFKKYCKLCRDEETTKQLRLLLERKEKARIWRETHRTEINLKSRENRRKKKIDG